MERLDRLGFAIVPSKEAGEKCDLVLVVDRSHACLVLKAIDQQDAERIVREVVDQL